jgi:hypothetical protein
VFINDNLSSTTGSLYFWEHYTTNSSHVLVKYQGGYATRNLVGGTPPISPAGISGLGSSSRIPNRYIPVGQGFFINGNATGGTINFNNSQRLFIKEDDAVNSNVLFRNNVNTSVVVQKEFDNKQDTIPQDNKFTKIRFSYISPDNNKRELLIGFMNERATSDIDPGYDAVQFDTQPSDLYFINNNTKLVIQGDTYFDFKSSFPLGVKTAIGGKAKFVLNQSENFDTNSSIYIYDNVTNLYHDIKERDFEIDLLAGTFDERFSLRFNLSSTLSANNLNEDVYKTIDYKVYLKNNIITTNYVEEISLCYIYDMMGRKVSNDIDVTNLSSGIYIAKLTINKNIITTKIIKKN